MRDMGILASLFPQRHKDPERSCWRNQIPLHGSRQRRLWSGQAIGRTSLSPRCLGTFLAFGEKTLVCQFLASLASEPQQRKLAEEGHTPSPVLAWW